MIRRRPAAPVSHDRWLVSYADFITLLFAFFVVMFAVSQPDKGKVKVMSESVRAALGSRQGKAPVTTVPPEIHPPDLTQYRDALQLALDSELRTGKLQMKLEGRGLVISMREATFFASGDEAIAPASMPIVGKIAAVVAAMPNPVRLEGHTDSRPIHTSRFRNNWELSSARSIAMLELLRDRFHIPQSRMAVAGYADNSPTDSNDTEEGRAHNRRVDLVLLSPDARRSEPPALE